MGPRATAAGGDRWGVDWRMLSISLVCVSKCASAGPRKMKAVEFRRDEGAECRVPSAECRMRSAPPRARRGHPRYTMQGAACRD